MTGIPSNTPPTSLDHLSKNTVFYTLTKRTANKLEAADSGKLQKTCGECIHVRRITWHQAKHSRILSAQVLMAVSQGHAGIAVEGRAVQFRQDIAEKLGPSRVLKVISHDRPDIEEVEDIKDEELEGEEVEADIEGVDADAYAALAASATFTEEEKKTKESQHHASTTPLPTEELSSENTVNFAHKSSLAVQNLASNIIKQLSTNEEDRRKSAEKKKEYQDEIDRTKLKDRILKEEIRKEEIVATEKTKSALRMNRNFDKPTHNK